MRIVTGQFTEPIVRGDTYERRQPTFHFLSNLKQIHELTHTHIRSA